MDKLVVRTFEEKEYHAFFSGYIPDPMMDASPFSYNYEQISRSYRYNHGGFRPDYVHYGAFFDQIPVGSLQLKRIDRENRSCEFGIILQNDSVKTLPYPAQILPRIWLPTQSSPGDDRHRSRTRFSFRTVFLY